MEDVWSAAAFACDITPPLGHPLCAGWYPPAATVQDRLHARGLILAGPGLAPVVLCALDWAELSNGDHARWREALAGAAGSTAERAAVHCTHAHDTPWPDRDAQNLLDACGSPDVILAGDWAERARDAVAEAVAAAWDRRIPWTHIATGRATVDRVASNRRILGDDGRVRAIRWTRTRDPEVRAAPEGAIDPELRTVGFWSDETPVAHLHYYAVHPTSVDGTGTVTHEFVGDARERRIRESGAAHVYFTGCAGDITAGKYNDATPESRAAFADRIHAAMVAAERSAVRRPLERALWQVAPVCLPAREAQDTAALTDPDASPKARSRAALMETYRRRQDIPIPVTALHLNDDTALLHLPAEAFVRFQRFAQDACPDRFVAVAAYGDCGPGYITHAGAAAEGGYEPTDAFVSERAEALLRGAILRALAAPPADAGE